MEHGRSQHDWQILSPWRASKERSIQRCIATPGNGFVAGINAQGQRIYRSVGKDVEGSANRS
jgi:hypothetical protein